MSALFDLTTPAPAVAGAGPTELAITVYGTPAGQGRVSFFKGRGVHSNADKLKPWREAISAAAQAVAGTHPYTAPPKPKVKPGVKAPKTPPRPCTACGTIRGLHGLLHGPVGIELTVSVAQSATAAKRGDAWPANRAASDVDHHARAILDALSHASVWCDDAQVVELCARKVWAGGAGIDALDRPGAVIRIWTLPAAVTR